MKFFSGFCFKNESELFSEYLESGDFCVAGFSKGAKEAFEYTFTFEDRVDKLQLFSPAFFQNKDDKFKRVQLINFKRDKKSYIDSFIKNSLYPSSLDLEKFFNTGSFDELKNLLEYIWEEERLLELKNRGVKIEVYLGELDKIIDSSLVADFFKPYADIYLFKNRGHILKKDQTKSCKYQKIQK